MNAAALIKLAFTTGIPLPELNDMYLDAEYNLVKGINANTVYQIPGMDGTPNENPPLLPLPAIGRVMTDNATAINGRNVVITVRETNGTPISAGSFLTQPFLLMDNDTASRFVYSPGPMPADIVVDFGALEHLTTVGMRADANNFGQIGNFFYTPPEFDIAVSTDDSSYTTIASVSNATWTSSELKTYNLPTPDAYRYVRFRIFDRVFPQQVVPQIAELTFA